jgi:hypothetical protein
VPKTYLHDCRGTRGAGFFIHPMCMSEYGGASSFEIVRWCACLLLVPAEVQQLMVKKRGGSFEIVRWCALVVVLAVGGR